ncbi:hypothetical protein YC2023_076482 [Brassica napus]
MIYLFYIDALGKLVSINNGNFNYPTGSNTLILIGLTNLDLGFRVERWGGEYKSLLPLNEECIFENITLVVVKMKIIENIHIGLKNNQNMKIIIIVYYFKNVKISKFDNAKWNSISNKYKEKCKTSVTESRHTKPKTKSNRQKMYHTKKSDRVENNSSTKKEHGLWACGLVELSLEEKIAP